MPINNNYLNERRRREQELRQVIKPSMQQNAGQNGYTAAQMAMFQQQAKINTAQQMYDQYRRELQDRMRSGAKMRQGGGEQAYERWRSETYAKARAGAASPDEVAMLRSVMGREAADNINFGASLEENRARYYAAYDTEAAKRRMEELLKNRDSYAKSTPKSEQRNETLARMDRDIAELQGELEKSQTYWHDDYRKEAENKQKENPQSFWETLLGVSASNTGMPQSVLPGMTDQSAAREIVGAGLEQAAAGYSNLAGTVLEGLGKVNDRAFDANHRQQKTAAENSLAYWQEKLESAETEEDRKRAETQISIAKHALSSLEELKESDTRDVDAAAQDVYDFADRRAASGAELTEQAKSRTRNAGMGTVGDLLVDAGVSGVQMLGDAAANAIVPGSGLVSMGARSFGSGAQEARQAGASFGQQLAYGAGSAAVEVATEKMFGVFEGVYGKGWLDNTKLAKSIAEAVQKMQLSPVGRTALSLLTNFGEEATEELVSGALNPALKSIYNGKGIGENYSEMEASDLIHDALVGGILGLVGGTNQVVQNAEQTRAMGEQYGADGAALVQEALELDPDNKTAQKAKERLEQGKKLSTNTLRTLVEQNEAKISGMEKAEGLPDAWGDNLTRKERGIISGNAANRVRSELRSDLGSDQMSNAWTETIGTERVARERLGRGLKDATVKTTGENVRVENMTSKSDGVVQYRATDGNTYTAEQLDLDEDTALLDEYAKDFGGAAATFVKMRPAEMPVDAYRASFNTAYQYGNAGATLDQAMNAVTELPKEIVTAAFYAGKGRLDFNTAQARVALGNTTAASAVKKEGAVTFDGVEQRALTAQQRASVYAMRAISKVTGINIRFFDSARSNFKGENGSYNPTTNEIAIDVNAGRYSAADVNQAVIMKTASHELTHFTQKNNPEGYRQLREFVVQHLLEKGETLESLAQSKIDRANGELDMEGAINEVIADACEDMLQNTTAIDTLAKENWSLFKSIRNWLHNFHNMLKKAFGSGYTHPEAQAMLDKASELQKIWDDAFVRAVQNYQQTAEQGKTNAPAAQERQTQKSEGVQHSIREIVGNSGKSYGRGVYMDSYLLSNLTEDERVEMFREYLDEISGEKFEATGKNGKSVTVEIADMGRRYTDHHGKRVRVNDDLKSKYKKSHAKQEAVALINEVFETATYKDEGPAKHPHGWLDDNGNNPWQGWHTYLQDHDGTVYEAILHITTADDGTMFLYDITPKKVEVEQSGNSDTSLNLNPEGSRRTPTSPSADSISNSAEKSNPQNEDGKNFFDETSKQSDRGTTRHSLRAPTDISSRELLANALEGVAQTKAEKDILQRYQARVNELGEIQQKLNEQRKLLREDANGTNKLTADERTKAKNRADIYARQLDRADGELLKLEATKTIREMMDREQSNYRAMLKEAEERGVLAGQMRQGARDAAILRRHDAKAREAVAEERAKNAARMERYNERMQRRIDEAKESLDNYREKRHETEARRKFKAGINRIANDFRQMILHPTDSRYAPTALMQSCIDVAMMVDTSGEREDTKAKAKFNEQMRRIADQYKALKDSKDSDYQLEYDADFDFMVEQLRQRLDGKAVRDLTVSELGDVYSVLRDISEMLKQAKYQIGKAEKVTNYAVGESIIRQQRAYDARTRGPARRAAAATMRLTANVERNVRRMTDYDNNAALYQLYEELNEGVRKKNRFTMTAEKEFDGFRGKRMRESATKLKTYNIGGVDVQMTEMQAMQVILSWEREATNGITRHLQSGGILIPDAALMEKGKGREAVRLGQVVENIREEDISALYDTMDEWARDYMDAAHHFFNETAQNAINEATMAVKHRRVATTQNYIPFEIDPDTVAQEIEGVKYDATIEGVGMLKSLQEGAANTLVIRGLSDIINRHIDKVGQVYGLMAPVKNYNKAMGIRLIGESVTTRKAINSDDMQMLDQAVTDLQTRRPVDRNAITKAFDKLQSTFVKATLLSNISVTIKQAASYSTAGLYLSQRALAPYQGTIARLFANPNGEYAQNLFAEIDEHTAAHYMRRRGMSMQEIAMVAKDDGAVARWMDEKIKNDALNPLKWIQNMDVATTAAIWLAAKKQVELDGLHEGDTGYWDTVTELYEKVLEGTQPMYDALHRPEIQKTTNAAVRSVLMFKTQPLQNAGVIWDAIGNYEAAKRNGTGLAEAKKQLGRAVGSQVASLAVFAAMSFLAYAAKNRLGRYKDDEEDLTAESIIKVILKDMAQNGAGLLLPAVGTEAFSAIDGIVQRATTGQRQYDTFSMPMVDMVNGWITDLGTVSTHLADLDSNRDKIGDDFRVIAMDVAALFGVPAENVYNIVRGTVGNVTDWAGSPLEWATDESNTVKGMKAAWSNGHYDRAKEKMEALIDEKVKNGKTLKDARSAIKSSMTSEFKPLYLTAYRAGDKAEMARIRKILQLCGLYDDVSKTLTDWLK